MKTISQSLIRDMLKPEGYCGHYLNEVYNNGFRTEPTAAMIDGLVFEQAILGATARGEHWEIPKLKNGDKSKREQDLDMVIAFAREVLKMNEIVIETAQPHIEAGNRSGHIDALGTYHGQAYIFDLKYTGMAYKTYDREIKFSDVTANYRLQALQYQSLIESQLPFMFLVFGDGWCRFFEFLYEQSAVEHHKEVASEALETFNEMDYRPTSDSRLCFTCPMASVCKVRNTIIQIEPL